MDGHYEKSGDIEEWVWDEGSAPASLAYTGGWVVPEGEFDPRGEADVKSQSEKLAEANAGVGLTVVEQPAETVPEPEAEPEPEPEAEPEPEPAPEPEVETEDA